MKPIRSILERYSVESVSSSDNEEQLFENIKAALFESFSGEVTLVDNSNIGIKLYVLTERDIEILLEEIEQVYEEE
jgi:hypothetical protein